MALSLPWGPLIALSLPWACRGFYQCLHRLLIYGLSGMGAIYGIFTAVGPTCFFLWPEDKNFYQRPTGITRIKDTLHRRDFLVFCRLIIWQRGRAGGDGVEMCGSKGGMVFITHLPPRAPSQPALPDNKPIKKTRTLCGRECIKEKSHGIFIQLGKIDIPLKTRRKCSISSTYL